MFCWGGSQNLDTTKDVGPAPINPIDPSNGMWATKERDSAPHKEMIRKRMDIGEHFTREVIQSIVFIFLPLVESVHLTNPIYCYYPLGYKQCDLM